MRLSPQTERAMLQQGELGTLLKIHDDSMWEDPAPALSRSHPWWARHQRKVIGTWVVVPCFALGVQLGAWLDQLI